MKRHAFLSWATAVVLLAAFLGGPAVTLAAQTGEETAGQGDQARRGPAIGENPVNLAQEQPRETLGASATTATGPVDQEKAPAARAESRSERDEIVVKTYTLKHIDWRELVEAVRLFLVQWTGADNTLTVQIRKSQIPDFEAALKKLDVEKRNIMFRVFTIIAARDNVPDIIKKPETREIDNRELKVALDELKKLWSFRHYWVDAPSFLTVKDGSGGSQVKLVSGLLEYADFEMFLRHVRLTGDEPGRRNINIGELKLSLSLISPNVSRTSNLIDTQDISAKENGYLVVGVSGLESTWSGLALILVISAEIK